jgi:hypothetical protein
MTTTEMTAPDAAPPSDLEALRRAVRRRALANLVLVLRGEAERTGGRLTVEPFARDAVVLRYRDVRTLVRRDLVFAVEPRDFAVLLACPPRWPLAREAQLGPVVLGPHDFAHPNSDGRGFCLDMMGVAPERIPRLLYDNLRLRLFRLDHCVDFVAADFVRAHLADFPADPRPLCPAAGADSGADA